MRGGVLRTRDRTSASNAANAAVFDMFDPRSTQGKQRKFLHERLFIQGPTQEIPARKGAEITRRHRLVQDLDTELCDCPLTIGR